MGKADQATTVFMRKHVNFAAAFNFRLYGGHTVIRPENLYELDSAELARLYREKDIAAVRKYRDVIRRYQDEEMEAYLVLAVEAQTNVHYAMPVKTMLYDAMQYDRQIEKLRELHKENKDSCSDAEFLSGFHRGDYLIPVITLTVHFGKEEWDGPRTLHEMLHLEGINPKVIEYVQDYRIHLITPGELTKEEFQQLEGSEFGEIMRFISLSENHQKMREYLETGSEILQTISLEGAAVLKEVTGIKLEYEEGKQVVDVCKAWEEQMEICRMEGRAEGRAVFIGLMKWLMSHGRSEEAQQMLDDEELQEQLLQEYREVVSADR